MGGGGGGYEGKGEDKITPFAQLHGKIAQEFQGFIQEDQVWDTQTLFKLFHDFQCVRENRMKTGGRGVS